MAELRISLHGQIISTHRMEHGHTYILGRDESCDIRLDQSVISRRHLSLESSDGDTWTVQKMSRHGKLLYENGNVESLSVSLNKSFEIPPFLMTITAVDAPMTESHASESTPASADSHFLPPSDRKLLPSSHLQVDEEATQIYSPLQAQASPAEIAYLMIENPIGEIVRLRLEGEQWTLGRDEAVSQITIHDLKCSRRHLQIRAVQRDYFVEDLASTQGTELNSTYLPPHHVQPLYSGDVLRVGDYKITFELHNPHFEDMLRQLTPDLLEPISVDEYQGSDQQELPVFGNPENFNVPASSRTRVRTLARQFKSMPRARQALLLLAIFFVGTAFISSLRTKPVQSLTQTSQTQDPFARLTAEQKQYVISSYNLGDTFMKRRNYDAALREFQKIHELIPSFQKSREYEEAARHALEAIEQKQALEQQEQKEDEVRRMVTDILMQCEGHLRTYHSRDELDACLQPLNELDPSNAKAEALKIKFDDSLSAKAQIRDEREAYVAGIKRGEKLYQSALDLEKSEKWSDAIAAFQAHIDGHFGDPKNLKESSKRELAKLQASLSAKVGALVNDANADYTNNRLRDAGDKLDRALKMDPKDAKARDLRSRLKSDLNQRMRVVYGDAILLESLGNIDEARSKWKSILKTDLKDEEYYGKAQSKLHKYGDK